MFVCSKCNNEYFDDGDFNSHPCVTESITESATSNGRLALLDRLLESGGCGQEYYDNEVAKLEKQNV